MPGRENEAVAIQPARPFGVVDEGMTKKDCADFGGAERQTEMPGRTRVDCVDGETACLVGSFGEEMSLQRHEEKIRLEVDIAGAPGKPEFGRAGDWGMVFCQGKNGSRAALGAEGPGKHGKGAAFP